jgi:D-xylose transport system permease protein
MTRKLERVADRDAHGLRLPPHAILAGVLAAMWLVLALAPATGGTFLTQGNIAMLLGQCAVLLVVAVGMTLVVIVRGIDLSVGAGVALTGVVAALALHGGCSAPVAIALALLVGAGIGAWHGLWIGRLGVPAFVVTLAGFKAYRGGALVLSNATSLSMSDSFGVLTASVPVAATWVIVAAVLAIGVASVWRDATRRRALGLPAPTTTRVLARMLGLAALAALVLAVFGARGMPVPVLVAAAVALAGVFVTRRTRLGRQLYAIGGNPEAARLSGIPVVRTLVAVYVILGVLTAVAGLLLAARVNGVTPGNQGNLLELDAVTAVVIGGTSLAGGCGSIVGTVLGTLVFATLGNGMNLLRIDSNWQLVCTGAILLVAVLVDVLSKGKRP